MSVPESPAEFSKSIVCVEDDLDTCEFLSILLREYRFDYFHSLATAVPELDRQADLYILDNWLPDGSGVDLCRRIRERYPLAPIIFTSAVAGRTHISEAMDAGADRYLLKPCDPDALQQIVKELLN
jgi:two-component system, OmpR family, response regulator